MWRVVAFAVLAGGCSGASTGRGAPPPVAPAAVVVAVEAPVPPVPEPVLVVPEPVPVVPEPVPVAPEPSGVVVNFVITPEIGEAPPVLVITVRNPAAVPVPMTRFEDARCVVAHYLDLRVARRGGKPQTWERCAVLAWPGREEPLAAGGERTLRVPFAELAARWPRGRYAVDVAWAPAELARVRGEAAAVRASQSSLNISSFVIARPLATVKIVRGATLRLPDGVALRFSGHSHKDIGPGESSPLMVSGAVTRAGEARAEEFSLNLHTEHSRIFWLQDELAFELVDYAYGEWMRLKYYGKLRRD